MARVSILTFGKAMVVALSLFCAVAAAKEIKLGSGSIIRKISANKDPIQVNQTQEKKSERQGSAGDDDDDDDKHGPSPPIQRTYTHYRPARNRLASELLDEYNNFPASESVTIEFGLSIVDLIQLDYSNQILVTSLRLHLRWKDSRLSWKPSKFDGIKKFALPPHRIWKPGVLLINSADEGFDGTFPISATVNNKGVVSYNPPGILRSVCWMNPEDFPFDYQNCSFKFGFLHDEGIENMDLEYYKSEANQRQTLLQEYTRNKLWDIVSFRASLNEWNYTGVSVTLPRMVFELELRRRPLYYAWSLVFPILIVSYAIPMLLLIPIGSMERIVCTFLICEAGPGIAHVRHLVPWSIPNTSESVTLLGKYGMLVSAWGLAVIVESVLELWWVRSRAGKTTGPVAAAGLALNGKVLDGDVSASTGKLPAPVGNLPSVVDKILAVVFYTSLTAYNGYLYGSLKYWQDERLHL